MASVEVGGAHEPRLTSIEYSPLTQQKEKEGTLDKEPNKLHENGRVNGLVGKQEVKKTEIEGNASGRPKA